MSQPDEFPKRYNYAEIESKWQRFWEEKGIYRFDREDRERPTYSIDTPPPYPSGEVHVGNALNFSYIDFVARYKRMRGYNVLFPQGWDCHGLPTEVRVEKQTGKKKSEYDPQEFIELCKKYTLVWIDSMRRALKALGLSIDWSTEYMTMDPSYWRKTQISFIRMYKKGLVYRDKHPVIWCPRCETAIAEAEVEYVEKDRPLYYFKFKVDETEEDLLIASTRPELLPSCVAVAVHPEDERYKHLVGKHARVPIFGQRVPIIADEEVDREFGTGAVMICTYGDKTDVKWQKRYNLPVVISINEKGYMNERAGPLAGLKVEEARRKVAELLKERGLLVKVETVKSSVGTCWRCHTPVEILPKYQWFVKSRELADKVLEEARKVEWIPPYMYKRLENWVKSLDWDWVISRQRLFATPFPVYYCRDCGHVIVVDEEHTPIDPRKDPPPLERCPVCGSKNLVGETDVMDTWMDSSITAAVHAGWPDNMDERLFPADLQPNGYDIIRTWDYYLILRGVALFGKSQFKTALINGMVRGTDGRMMHKSYGNYVALLDVIERFGADTFRLWVATAASTGQDVRFSWDGLKYTKRFLTKIWNASRFAHRYLREYSYDVSEKPTLTPIDNWILRELADTVKEVTKSIEKYDFQGAALKLIDFSWHKLCDHYLEAIKYRLARGGDKAALYTLSTVLLTIYRMLSIFTPHISEELYHRLFPGYEWESITIAPWPEPPEWDEAAARLGEKAIKIIAEVRRLKHDERIPLGAEVSEVRVCVPGEEAVSEIERIAEDIAGTMRAKSVVIRVGEDCGRKVEGLEDISVSLIK